MSEQISIEYKQQQYDISLKINDMEFGSAISSISFYAVIDRIFPYIFIDMVISERDFTNLIRMVDTKYQLTIKHRGEQDQAIKTFEFNLALVTYSFNYPVRGPAEQIGVTAGMSGLRLRTVPITPYLYANHRILAKVFQNKKMEDILMDEHIVGEEVELEIDPDLDNNKKEFEELFVPTMRRWDIFYFLNKYQPFYQSPFLLYATYENEDGAKISDKDMKLRLTKLNKQKKEGAEPITIYYVNDMKLQSGRINQISPDNKEYLAYNQVPLQVYNFKNPIVEGYSQRYVFKPLDYLYKFVMNKLGQEKSDAVTTDDSKKGIYVLSGSDREVEINQMIDAMESFGQGFTNKLRITGWTFREHELNQWIRNYNDAMVSNHNVNIFLNIVKGIRIEHFLIPGRYATVKASPDAIQMKGTFFIRSAHVVLTRGATNSMDSTTGGANSLSGAIGRASATFMASAAVQLSRANINPDKDSEKTKADKEQRKKDSYMNGLNMGGVNINNLSTLPDGQVEPPSYG